MDNDQETVAEPTFTRDEFRDAPSKVMRAVEQSGRVVVTDQTGHPRLTIARQAEELTSG